MNEQQLTATLWQTFLPFLRTRCDTHFAINAICFQIGHSCSNGIFLIKIIPHSVGCVLLNISEAATKWLQEEVEAVVKCRLRNVSVTLYYIAMINYLPFSLKECEWTRWRCVCLGVPPAKWKILWISAMKRVEIDCLFQFLKECKRIQPNRRKSICFRLKYARRGWRALHKTLKFD